MLEHGPILKDVFHCRYFKINTVSDSVTVELCGALKVCKEPSWFCIYLPIGMVSLNICTVNNHCLKVLCTVKYFCNK